MGRLTDDMTRLCGEIGALRSSREVFISDLRQRHFRAKGRYKKDAVGLSQRA